MSSTAPIPTHGKTPPDAVLERVYQATQEEVWAMWTTRESFASWWLPVGIRAEVLRFEPRAGGSVHYRGVAESPEVIAALKEMGLATSNPVTGTFSEFVPKTRLVLEERVDFVPGVPPFTVITRVDLVPAGTQVRMIVTLWGGHTAEFASKQIEGLTSQISKLDAHFGWVAA